MAITSASTSASHVQKSFKYDVFLSFRGEDTRKNFVDHLYHALHQKGIITYKDDEKIEKGERINEQLIRAIKDSRFYIIVFSKNYASSSWCLDELVQIMECQKMTEHSAYPVFYDVEPTEVCHQSGVVGEAFAKLVGKGKWKRTEEDADLFGKQEKAKDVERWTSALKNAAGLAGWELKNTVDGHEAKFIEKIIEEISPTLYFINLNIDDNLVAMEIRVKNVVSSLKVDSDDILMIGIKGMGGGGKTTLARAIFDHISIRFESKSFVENVREASKGSGLKKLQKQVLQDVLNDKKLDVKSVYDGKNWMKMMMHSRKVLVVLDDVDHIEQLEALAGEPNWFKPGSRIIITTRDEQVLIAHKVNSIHNVNLLSNEEAICLFSRHAFGREVPFQGYEELSRKVVHYAASLPLTIKVLGSHLCGRSQLEWVDAINRLKIIPLKETLEKLEISFKGLENDLKEIFLDVVCILKGETKDKAIRILGGCGFNAQIGLRVLQQKSLITVSESNTLGFHDHIEEMGRNIVRRLHPNKPSRHSRLWVKEEIENILVNKLGTEETRSIRLQLTDVNPTIVLKGLRKMNELCLLYVNDKSGIWSWKDNTYSNNSIHLQDASQSLWSHQYPFRYFSKVFKENKLVNLGMWWSSIFETRKVRERKVLNKLKFLKLSCLKLRTFDLMLTPNLEVLDFEGCEDFVELRMPAECPNLKFINLRYTKVSYLNLGLTPHLEVLDLEQCADFEELHMPVECLNLKFLNLNYSRVSYLNFGQTPHLEGLYIENCSYLQNICSPVGCLKSLVDFKFKIYKDYAEFSVYKRLKSANLDSVATFKILVGCRLHPDNNLPRFRFTCKYNAPRFSWSVFLENLIPFGPCACKNLDQFSTIIYGLQHIKEVTLEGSIPLDLQWWLESLEKLYLNNQEFQHLPDSICMLKHLKSLKVHECLAFEQLPENICKLECLEVLHITGCKSLRDIPNSICKLKCLKSLLLASCKNIKKLPEELGSLECLRVLWITNTGISLLPPSIYQFRGLRIYGSRKQLESYGFTPFGDGSSFVPYVDL